MKQNKRFSYYLCSEQTTAATCNNAKLAVDSKSAEECLRRSTHARTDGRTTRKHNASDPKHKMLFTSLRITYFSALLFYCTSTTDDERGLTKAIRKRHSADLLIDSECAQQESLYDWHTSSGHVVSLPSPILALLNATVRQRRVYKLHTTCSMEWKNVDDTHHGAICMSPYRSADNPTTNS